jgi:FlaG/FlaF family flagellin (archaellin)
VQRSWKRRGRSARSLRSLRGVSEVLGTILILALTVVLFSSIFFFVNTFPKPASQSSSQFQGQLTYGLVTKGANTWTNVTAVSITHLAGPVVSSFNVQIYVVSQQHPLSTPNSPPWTLASGGIVGSWGTGQVWNLNVSSEGLSTPDNITVTVVAQGNVVYRQILPGTNPSVPPIFQNEGTVPATVLINSKFSIFVQINDPFLPITSKRVYLNISTPGLTCTNPLSAYSSNTTSKLQMTYNGTNGLWFLGGCTASTAQSYYVSVWVTDADPIQALQNSIVFPVTVASSGGSSPPPSCSNTFSAVNGSSPSHVVDSTGVTIYLNVTNGNACDWITFSGNWTGSVTAGTFTAVSPSTVTTQLIPVGQTKDLTFSWTAPTATCGGGHGTCTGTATLTFTFSYTSGATGDTTTVLKIAY